MPGLLQLWCFVSDTAHQALQTVQQLLLNMSFNLRWVLIRLHQPVPWLHCLQPPWCTLAMGLLKVCVQGRMSLRCSTLVVVVQGCFELLLRHYAVWSSMPAVSFPCMCLPLGPGRYPPICANKAPPWLVLPCSWHHPQPVAPSGSNNQPRLKCWWQIHPVSHPQSDVSYCRTLWRPHAGCLQ
jgi:hypothetical protein